MIMIESEGITENVRSWRTDVISAITSALPADKIMYVACVMYTDLTADVLSAFFSDSNGIGNDGYRFEAAEPPVFAYHIQSFSHLCKSWSTRLIVRRLSSSQ